MVLVDELPLTLISSVDMTQILYRRHSYTAEFSVFLLTFQMTQAYLSVFRSREPFAQM